MLGLSKGAWQKKSFIGNILDMNKNIRNVVFLVLGLFLVGFLIWSFVGRETTEIEPETTVTEIGYFTEDGQDDILVFYDSSDNTALMYSSRYAGVVLNQIPSVSGVRYENSDIGMVLWDKGGEVNLLLNDEPIFVGYTREYLAELSADNISLLTSEAWLWEETVMGDDEVITPSESGQFVVIFRVDGTVSGTTDCNNFVGRYSVGQSSLTFSDVALTRMFCEDSQELEFVDMLNETTSYTFNEDNNLVLLLAFDSGSVFFSK